LALSVFAHQGRFVARQAMLGVRRLDTLRELAVVHGEEHAVHTPGPKILLGFHLGPPGVQLLLWLRGHRLTWIGGPRVSPGWSRILRLLDTDPAEILGQPQELLRLYTAHRALAQGRSVYMNGDGVRRGRFAFRVPVPGGHEDLNAGWFMLRRRTGVPTLPVTSHSKGRWVVVRVHPPLPDPQPDVEADVAACRAALAPILRDHVQSFPEQCRLIAFGPPPG
jgi:hypothetical protein